MGDETLIERLIDLLIVTTHEKFCYILYFLGTCMSLTVKCWNINVFTHMCTSCTSETLVCSCHLCLILLSLFPIGEQPIIGKFIRVGIGVGMFLLLVLLTSVVVLILVVVVKRRKGANKQKRRTHCEDSLYYNNIVTVTQETEMKEQDTGTDHQDAGHHTGEGEDLFNDVSNPYEVVDKVHSEITQTLAPKESSTPASATNVPSIYAVVDKSKKRAKKTAVGSTVINKDELYAKPMRRVGKITDGGEGMVASAGAEEGEQ